MSERKGPPPALAVAIIVIYLALAVTLALWAAGALFFLMHRAAPHGVTPVTWLTYVRFYWANGHQRQLLLLSIILPAALSLFPLSAILSWLGGQDRELHGSAKFATDTEIKEAGLLGATGIIVGKLRNRFLQFAGQQFVLLAAPTRSGKGVSIVIPNLLNWPDSCVVLDIKLENFLLTSGYRARHGQKVFLWNPYAEDGRTHRWNPLDSVSRDPYQRVGDLHALAGAIYPTNPNDKDGGFWSDNAKNLFLALALMIMDTPASPLTLGEILRQASGKGKPLRDYLTDQISTRANSDKPFSGACLDALNRFLSAPENTMANILISFNAPLTAFANPRIDAATAESDFDIARVRQDKMTIYIGIQPNRLADAALLMNVFFSQLIHVNTRDLPVDAGSHQCLLILDEFSALGRINIIATANAFIAGYGLRLLTVIQSIAQLESVYGPKDARTLMTNHALQILFTPREQADANAYSEMLGYYTVKSTSTGRSINRGFGSGGSNSENVSDQRRALMLPQELKAMPDDDQVIVMESTPPIRCRKAKYFKEAAFLERLREVSETLGGKSGSLPKALLDKAAFQARELAVGIPSLDLDSHIARVERRLRPLKLEDGVDLARLDLAGAKLTTFVDPKAPTDQEIEAFVDDFFALGHPPAGHVDLSLAPLVGADPPLLLEA